jgi:hypothetical protein
MNIWDQFEERIYADKRLFTAGADLRLIMRNWKATPFLPLQNFGLFPRSDRNPFEHPYESPSSPSNSET